MISMEEFRDRLTTRPSEDDLIEVLREEVILMWEAATGRLWNARTGHVQLIEPATSRIRTISLELRPVTSITTVEEKLYIADDWTELTVDSDYYVLQSHELRKDGCWGEFVRVTYDGGTENADADVKRALVTQASFLAQRLQDERIIKKGESVSTSGGGASSTFFERADYHPMFLTIAKRYQRF